MGNHEYCEECGASDFHYGRPCNPIRKATHQSEKAAIKNREKRAEAAAISTAQTLRNLGFEVEIDGIGNIKIDKYSLLPKD